MDWVAGSAAGSTVSVRVVPRSRRPGLELTDRGPAIRVRAAPEGGRATEEARRRLAEALSVPPSRVRLRTGMTSRAKTFEVDGVAPDEVVAHLSTPED